MEVRKIAKHLKDNDDDKEMELDWKFAGMVIDRLCLFIFSILTIIFTCGILFSSRNFFKFK